VGGASCPGDPGRCPSHHRRDGPTGSLGETTYFTDTTTGEEAIAYGWGLGDGATPAETNPTHSHAAGTYTATMLTTNACVWDGATHAITAQEPAPSHDYIYLPQVYRDGAVMEGCPWGISLLG